MISSRSSPNSLPSPALTFLGRPRFFFSATWHSSVSGRNSLLPLRRDLRGRIDHDGTAALAQRATRLLHRITGAHRATQHGALAAGQFLAVLLLFAGQFQLAREELGQDGARFRVG